MKVKLKLSPSAWVGLFMLAVFVLAGVFGPWIAPYDVGLTSLDLDHRFEGPSADHWLGTDSKGADTLSQLLWGARSALQLSFIVVAISSTIGLAVGTMAGWFRGIVDEILMRFVDILMAFPGILLNIAIVATVARPGLGVMIAALCANGWVGYARVARGQVLALRERDYVTAAVALGASNRRVMFKHLIPNLMGPALVQMSFGFGGVILVEAALSFLGLGVDPAEPSIGVLLAESMRYLTAGAWWLALLPGLCLLIVVKLVDTIGENARALVDPRSVHL